MAMRPPGPKQLVAPTVLLAGGFLWYLVSGSIWFNVCKGKIDYDTFMPDDCIRRNEQAAQMKPNEPATGLFPDYASKESYADIKAFWGDDLISQGFSAIGSVAADGLRPAIPVWNSFFAQETRRTAVTWMIGILTSALAAKVVHGWWDYHHSAQKENASSDSQSLP